MTAEMVRALRQAGFMIVVATNQSAVARGTLTEDDLEKIRMPEVSHDVEATDRLTEIAHELFDGLLRVCFVDAGHVLGSASILASFRLCFRSSIASGLSLA